MFGSTVSAQDMGVSFPSLLQPSQLPEHNLAQPAEGKGHITVAEEPLETTGALIRLGLPLISQESTPTPSILSTV